VHRQGRRIDGFLSSILTFSLFLSNMVISSTLTTQLENVRAPAPLSRTRPRSVPRYTSKSPTSQPPAKTHTEKRRRPVRQIYVEDKQPFVYYASAYIDPYRSLTPILIYRNQVRRMARTRSRNSRLTHSRPRTTDTLSESIYTNDRDSRISERTTTTTMSKYTIDQTSIDINPLEPRAFDTRFCRKRQMIVDNPFYREKINTWKAMSLNHLVTLITELTLNKQILERLWIIYYWIAENIRYDIDADFNSHNRHQKAEDVFRSGKSTCEGYASIFQALCDALQIPCVKILGYAKDYSFKIDQSDFSSVNHTWNAVQFDNQFWYLIDSAWGTGYIDGNHEYKKDLKPHYFLTRPEQMIYNHLPEDCQWQLLTKPITMHDYLRLPQLHSYYFIFNLSIISPRYSSIVSFDAKQSFAEVLIHAPDNIQLTCSIKDDARGTTLTQYDFSRQVWQCLFSPYKIGFHTLIVFANEISSVNLLKNVLEFGLEINDKSSLRSKCLPITFGKFTEHKCQLFSPLDGVLKRGTKVTIRCRMPNALSARISLDGIWLDEMKLKNDIFKQQINVPDREIIVYAQFIDKKKSKTYDGLIRYSVEK